MARALGLTFDAVTNPERVRILTRFEAVARRLPVLGHELINQLAPDHKLLDHGWVTRKNTRGDTEWIPPAHLERGQARTNSFHQPEKLLRTDEEGDP